MRHLETGVLYCGDNLERLSVLPSESVDLIYLDPPFFSNRNYEVIWGDEAEVRSFEDRWEGGINHYIGWMRERMMEMHRILKPTGSLYLHCDPHASHYLKVMADDFFGAANFRNEIVWKRTSAHSSAKRYGPAHDVLLFYAKSQSYTWNSQYTPYDESYVQQKYRQVDENGRRYQLDNLTGSGTRNGETGQPWRGVDVTSRGRHWGVPPSRLDELDAEGRIYWPPKGGLPRYKRYLDEMLGLPLQDVFTDVQPINSQAAERLGYPTQKPEALLERLIQASSNPGDVVLDPFCGCGTTIAVSERLARQWIGVDISPTAVNIMKARVEKLGGRENPTTVKVYGMPTSEEELRSLKPFEFQNWVIQRVDGTHSPKKTGDMGIDGFSFLEHVPIQVKRSDRVGRNVVDNFETAVERYGADKGYIVAFSFTKGAQEEVARVRAAKGLQLELVTVKDLLLGTSELVAPVLNRSVVDLPLPPARPKGARPTAAQLVKSDQQAEEVA